MMPKQILCSHITLFALLCCSCTTLQNGIFTTLVDRNNGDQFLQKRGEVQMFLENVVAEHEQYTIQIYERTLIRFQIKRTKLMTHTYFVFFDRYNEYHTLSFYGTKLTRYSQGAWVMDSDYDQNSYQKYLSDSKSWDVAEVNFHNGIDVEKTAKRIIEKMYSGITYYYKDHIVDKPDMENCNTALYDALVYNEVVQ